MHTSSVAVLFVNVPKAVRGPMLGTQAICFTKRAMT
jgi:hypothetical protein